MKFLLCALLGLLGAAAVLAAQPSSTNSDQATLVQGNNAFAIDLYGQLRQQPGNLFFSPASISTAFAMAYAGAHGQTATEMAAALHFKLPPDQLHPAMGALLASLNAAHAGYELHVADALWAENGEAFLPAFLSVTKADYAAGFHPVDFKADPNAVSHHHQPVGRAANGKQDHEPAGARLGQRGHAPGADQRHLLQRRLGSAVSP